MTGVDLVLQGGIVRTGDAGTRARALAVHDGRVVALDVDALALAVTPARSSTWTAAPCCRLRRRPRPPALGRRRARRAAGPRRHVGGRGRRGRTPVGGRASRRDLGQGGPYDPSPRTRRPLRRALAGRRGRRPPGRAEATDHHCAWVNSGALRRAGIDEHTPDPPAATVARRPTAPRWGRWSSGPRWTWCCGTRRPRPTTRSSTGWPPRRRCSPRPASPGRRRPRCAPTTSPPTSTARSGRSRPRRTSRCARSRGNGRPSVATFAAAREAAPAGRRWCRRAP